MCPIPQLRFALKMVLPLTVKTEKKLNKKKNAKIYSIL